MQALPAFFFGASDEWLYTIAMDKTFTMVVRPDEESKHMAHTARTILEQNGLTYDDEKPDTVFVIGGDGTFLFAVHLFLERLNEVKFYGIHTGTLGFYTDYRSGDLDEWLNAYLNHTCLEESHPLLKADTDKGTFYGMNEVRVENVTRTQDLKISINGKLFEKFRGTGICISTQLGSTAYNRSLGGAVISDDLDLIEMTEIAGIHHHMYRSLGAPFIMKSDAVIDLDSDSFVGAMFGADSEVFNMDEIKHVKIQKAHRKVRMLRGRKISYFDRLQSLF